MNGSNEKKWYVVKAISGKEKKVKEYLESEIKRLNLQDQIFQVLIPTDKYFEVKNGKKISIFPVMCLSRRSWPVRLCM